MTVRHAISGFYAVLDRDDEALARALVREARVLQVRIKPRGGRADAADLVRIARMARRICDNAGAALIVNDRIDVALAFTSGRPTCRSSRRGGSPAICGSGSRRMTSRRCARRAPRGPTTWGLVRCSPRLPSKIPIRCKGSRGYALRSPRRGAARSSRSVGSRSPMLPTFTVRVLTRSARSARSTTPVIPATRPGSFARDNASPGGKSPQAPTRNCGRFHAVSG
jgi:hypothetical protein